jgi:Protein of unknown function (DUF1579)
MQVEPQEEHRWLQKFVGEWTSEMEMDMGPDQPTMKSHGTESVRSLGGLWIIAEGKGEMPDGNPAIMIMTLGYNPQTRRYTGTWIGSMMTHLWIYDGELDAAKRVLTLAADGPSMTDPSAMMKYKDVIEFKSDDHRILTSHMLADDGKWRQFMTAHYRRAK